MLSGVSSHVTGMPILSGVVDSSESTASLQKELSSLTRKMHLVLMASATLQGVMLHAAMVGEDQIAIEANALANRLNSISTSWLLT